MTLAWLFPLGFIALAALVVPPLLHLTRRLELRTQAFAALRWLREHVRPRRRVRFVERALLVVRLLLLAAIALLFAQPVIEGERGAARAEVLVAPGVPVDAARAAVASPDARWRWLVPGLPAIDEARVEGHRTADIASLLREADAALPDGATITVVVPPTLAGLDAERLRLRHAIAWRPLDGAVAAASPARADVAVTAPRRLVVRYPADDATAPRIADAIVAAWHAEAPDRVTLDAQVHGAPLPDPANAALLWLGAPRDATLDAWIARGGTALVDDVRRGDGDVIASRDDGRVLARARPIGRGRLVQIVPRWQPAAMPELLEPTFPARLDGWLRGAAAPTVADARAVAPTHEPMLPASSARAPLSPWLLALVALLFALERWWSGGRRPEAAA